MKKDDVRSTRAYREMAANVFGEFQAAGMAAKARGAPAPDAAAQRKAVAAMHEETLARIGKPTTPSAKAPAKASVQKSLVLGTKPRAKRTTGSKGK